MPSVIDAYVGLSMVKPGGTYSMFGFPQEYAPVVCRDFAPKVDPDLNNLSSDLANRFRLLCVFGGDDMSSLCVPPGLFDRALSQLTLSELGILVVAGVRHDVSGQALYPGGTQYGLSALVGVR